MPIPVDAMAQVRQIIKWDGMQSGLQYLNGLSDHRYTGLFLFDDAQLKNTFLYDRDDPHSILFPTFPANASYCLLVKEGGMPLKVVNAPQDDRLAAHPARQTVQSYCGAPLRDPEGGIFGTICNFSMVPCDGDDELLVTLNGFAAVLLDCERLREIGWRPKTGQWRKPN